MSKYIDAEKLIERLEEMKQAEYENCGGVNSKTGALQEVQELIDSLQQEQPEEVLTDSASFTKELKRYLSDTENEKKRGGVILPVLKHFYFLGLNARKEK